MKQEETNKEKQDAWLASIERALTRAAEEARKVARFYGTPIYVQGKDGKIVALKP
jgi:hypothetical protein